MNILLTAVNARYSHTNLAVRYLQNALMQAGIVSEIAEYTINEPVRAILADIARRAPDLLLFSCYIWNIDYIRRIGADFRLLNPGAAIVLGGPEVSFDAQAQLDAAPWANAVISGEGEPVIAEIVRMKKPRGVFAARSFADLNALPFPYGDLCALSNRVLYYESTRGCPYGCSYCLSSADRTVRTRALPLVFDDLRRFLDARAMQVKFVDRTFNLDAARAEAVWRFLIEHDNGVTSFQMELGGDLLTPDQLELLRTARPGLFQFEIGVQSTCVRTLEEICRKTDLARLAENLHALRDAGNIPLHLDLIAGLPLEGFSRFAQSFNDVFALRPHQLQLGFLKLLRGSALYAERAQYGLVHSEAPPYEILRTPQLSFLELVRLKIVEDMTEVYYNSGRFSHTLSYALALCPSPFDGLLALGEAAPARSVSKYERYDLLYDFCVARGGDPAVCRWLLKYDLCLHERPRRLPVCCPETAPAARRAVRPGTNTHVELFPFDVTDPARAPGETALLFDYMRRDLNGRAHTERIRL